MKADIRSWWPVCQTWIRRQPRAAIGVGLGLFLLLLWVLYVPTWGSIRVIQGEREALQSEMENAWRVLEQMRDSSIPLLPSVSKSSEALTALQDLAESHEVQFLSVSPGNPREGSAGEPVWLPVELQVEGGYRSIGNFLGDLHRGRAGVARVRQLRIGRDEQLLPRLRATLSLELAFGEEDHVT